LSESIAVGTAGAVSGTEIAGVIRAAGATVLSIDSITGLLSMLLMLLSVLAVQLSQLVNPQLE
jgi:hypothetical protein